MISYVYVYIIYKYKSINNHVNLRKFAEKYLKNCPNNLSPGLLHVTDYKSTAAASLTCAAPAGLAGTDACLFGAAEAAEGSEAT